MQLSTPSSAKPVETIYCYCGRPILCDEEDHALISQFKWSCIGQTGVRATPVRYINDRVLFISHLLWEYKEGLMIDHIDRDKHNNRKSNFRYVTKQQNTQNASVRKDNSLGLKGIIYRPDNNCYRVRIQANGVRKNLGNFKTLEQAIKVYNEAAVKYHGEFAVLNKI